MVSQRFAKPSLERDAGSTPAASAGSLVAAARALVDSDTSRGIYLRRFDPKVWRKFLDALDAAELALSCPASATELHQLIA